MNLDHYSLLAELFDFPGPGYHPRARRLRERLAADYPEAAAELQLFLDVIPSSANALQELYTRTFEVQSLTTLSIGYILFGDDYKRGDLLANLNREHTLVANDCRGELADHLPNVLRLIPLIEDEEVLGELMLDLLLPALTLMTREFDAERVVKKNVSYEKHYKTLIETPAGTDGTIFCRALKTVLMVMRKDLAVELQSVAEFDVRHKGSDFLGMVEKEMAIEQYANPQNSGGDH